MRSKENSYLPGGKGINVARVCKTIGTPAVRSIVMLPRVESDLYKDLLNKEGHEVQFVDIDGGIRHAILINQETNSHNSVIIGKGPELGAQDWDKFCEQVASTVRSGEIVVEMGSLPPGFPSSAINALYEVVHRAGAQLLVDSSPSVLKTRGEALLDFVTPNLEEAEALVHGYSTDLYVVNDEDVEARALAAADALFNSVASTVLITCGKHGVAVKSAGVSEWIPAYLVSDEKFKSSVGAGDSFVAGFATYLEQHSHDLVQAVKFGMSCAAAQCETYEPGNLSKQRAYEIFEAGRA